MTTTYHPTADEQADYANQEWSFGDHTKTVEALEPGVYNAIVKSCKLALDRETGRPIEDESNGKRKIDVTFEVPEFESTVQQRITISFGQNTQTKAWSMMAQFVAATTGIAPGSPEQAQVGPSAVVGKAVRIMVDVKDSGYNKVTKIMPAAVAPKRAAKPAPSAMDEIDEEIPF